MEWTPADLATDAGGVLERDGGGTISGAFIDSRSPVPGALFVPIVAARDGHDFIGHAVREGARAVLIQRDRAVPNVGAHVTVVAVEDTQRALDALAVAARARVRGPVVAITGSNGKTTTRSYVQAVLASAFRSVLCTKGNLNNHLGVPLTLLGTPHAPDAMVLELGMSAPGENAHLARMVAPTVGVITSVGIEHFEFFESIEDIADAEFEVAAHIHRDGALVIPCDEALLTARAPRRACADLMPVGPCADARVRLTRAWIDGSHDAPETHAEVTMHDGKTWTVRLRSFGLHNARNAAAALGVASALGLPIPAAIAALEQVVPVGDRGRSHRVGPHLVVSDCYNANPSSMEAALSSFATLRAQVQGPLIAVLGDMLELGPRTDDFHREVGARAAALGLDALIGVGEASRHAVAAAREAGVEAFAAGRDEIDEVVSRVQGALADGAPGAVLVKASRGLRLERVVEALRAAAEA